MLRCFKFELERRNIKGQGILSYSGFGGRTELFLSRSSSNAVRFCFFSLASRFLARYIALLYSLAYTTFFYSEISVFKPFVSKTLSHKPLLAVSHIIT